MKIRRLKIKNYKVFDDVEFDFTDKDGNTLDTIVLAGVNGSGKTTLLKLIGDVFSNKLENYSVPSMISELFSCEKVEMVLEIHTSFIESIHGEAIADKILSLKNEITGFYKFTFDKHSGKNDFYHFLKLSSQNKLPEPSVFRCYFIPSETYINDDKYFFSQNNSYKNNPKEDLEAKINQQDNALLRKLDFQIHKNIIEKYVIEDVLEDILQNRNRPANDIIEKKIENYNKVLSGINVNTKIKDISTNQVIFKTVNKEQVKIEDLSSGEKHLYYRGIYLHHLNIKNSIILVDEPEDSLHPSWQSRMAKFYNNIGKNNQVFLATHSPHIIASVKPESLFLLAINEETQKVEVINMGKTDQPTKGLEPNRVLQEIMGLESLRDVETQEKIDELRTLLTPEKFDSIEAKALIEELTLDLGRKDPYIMRLQNQLLLLERKRKKQTA
ncbi:MAG: AAA family ATPase [Chitinophagales bacterium]